MQATLLLGSSALLQFIAAALALRLIRITGGRWAWSLIAAAVALMAVRRSITLTRIFTDGGSMQPDLWAELVALIISILMVAGLTVVGPLFQSIQRSQEAREASQQRFRNLVDTVDAIVWEADLTRCRFTFVNQRAETLLGHPLHEWTQEPNFWVNHLHPDDREAIVAYCRSQTKDGEDHELEYRTSAADGSTVWLSDSVRIVKDNAGRPVGLRGVMIDISARKSGEAERERLEQELRQSQKMEAVGTLAAGIAHDFNNLLTAIFGYTELAKLHAGNPEATSALEKVEFAAKQAAGVTRSLLTFTRNEPSQKRPLDVREPMRQAVRVLRRVLPDAVEVISLLPDQPVWVNADATQLQQILINLAVNARDAMPEGGELRISLVRQEVSAGDGIHEAQAETTGQAVITVQDNGTGIPPEVQARIFEPFFTTKPRGQGTGLGMSIVHGIVKDHGGSIALDSKPGQGLSVAVTLPCCLRPDAAPDSQAERGGPCGNGELVIVAEDDQQVRAITASTLTSAGYDVMQARDGAELMRLFGAHGNEVKLIVVDVDMPKKRGPACLAEIRKTHARIPVVISTGNVDFELDESLAGQTVLIRKPFRMSQLTKLVHETLDRAALETGG